MTVTTLKQHQYDNMVALQFDGSEIVYTPDQVVWLDVWANNEIINWANEQGCSIDLLWYGNKDGGNKSKWGLKDPQELMMFTLRWG
jgi:hypothetical protein